MRDEYFFNDVSNEENYSNIPSHQISITRLIQKQPFFKQLGETIQKKKKIFILPHTLIHNFNSDQVVLLIKQIEAFRAEGFMFYHFFLGDLFPLNCDRLIKHQAKLGLPADSNQQPLIQKASQELNLTADQIYIFTPDRLDQFMSVQNIASQQMQSVITKKESLILKGSQVSVNSLKNYRDDDDKDDEIDVQKILNTQPIKKLALNDLTLIDEISVDGDFSKLEIFEVSNSVISAPNLKKFLTNAKAIHSIVIDHISLDVILPDEECEVPPEKRNACGLNFFSNYYDFPQIKNVQINNIETDDQNGTQEFLWFLADSVEAMESLELNNCQIELVDKNTFVIEKLSFPKLKTIKMDESTIAPNILELFIKNAPSLQTIEISNSEIEDEDESYDDKPASRPKLQSLEVSPQIFDSISENKNIHLLTQTQEITYIGNTANNKFESLDDDTQATYPNVKILNLINIKFSRHELSLFLKQFPHIQYLLLRNCYISPATKLNAVSLKNLIKLSVDNCTLKLSILEKLKQLAHPDIQIDFDSENDESSTADSENEENVTFLDADTTLNPNKTFYLDQLFWAAQEQQHPPLSSYRISVHPGAMINEQPCQINQAFSLLEYPPEQLNITPIAPETIQCHSSDLFSVFQTQLPQNPSDSFFYSKQSIMIKNQHWTALASLSPREKIISYHTLDGTPIEFGYSMMTNLHYVRPTIMTPNQKALITLEFIIQCPKPLYYIAQQSESLHILIEYLIDDLKKYQAKPLKLDTKTYTGKDYYQAITQQRVGACRHRTFVFLYEATELIESYARIHADRALLYQKPQIRIINNDCHSYVEIYMDNTWHQINLGGYPAKIEINTNNLPDLSLNQDPETAEEAVTSAQTNHLGILSAHDSNQYFPQSQYFADKIGSTTFETLDNLIQSIARPNIASTLVMLNHTDEVSIVRHALQKHFIEHAENCFNITHANDLICHSASITLQADHKGFIQPGPSGRLYQFLTQTEHKTHVLLIDLRAFQTRDLVKFNGLLDPHPHADGTPLPLNTRVILLMNINQAGAYQGADLQSRCTEVIKVSESFITSKLPSLYQNEPITQDQDVFEVELYQDQNWEEILLGRWTLHHQAMHFTPGALLQALKQNCTTIHLKNKPSNNPRFDSFWRDALLYGEVNCFGQTLAFDQSIKLVESDGYELTALRQNIITNIDIPKVCPEHAELLNASLMPSFFGAIQLNDEQHSICQIDGILSEHANSTIMIYLTHTLTLASWALFLNQCQQHNIKFKLSIAPGVTLPEAFEFNIPESPEEPITLWIENSLTDSYIVSNDIDATIAKSFHDAEIIIDVSELEPNDLLDTLTIETNPDQQFLFTKKIGYLLKTLNEGQQIILKGHFKDTLCHHLTKLLLNRQKSPTSPGRLLLISQQKNLFPGKMQYQDHISLEDKKSLLNQSRVLPNIDNEQLLKKHSFSELKAIQRLHNLDHFAKNDDITPWIGLETLPRPTINTSLKLDKKNAEFEAYQFNKKRLLQVQNMLEVSPFIFLSGMTGVGKTTFILEIWKKHNPQLFIGIEAIQDWVACQTPGLKTLFIDEANLSSRQWSEFEGLFNRQPAIFLNHQYIELTPAHKIIFAGNPKSYGAGRETAALFKRHGNCILFEPMPFTYIYHEILKPIFLGEPKFGKSSCSRYSKLILQLVNFLNKYSQDKLLYSPREIAMIALLGRQDVHRIVHYVYWIGKSLVPKQHLAEFETQFNSLKQHCDDEEISFNNLIINTHNRPTCQAILDFLNLRNYRRHTPGAQLNSTQLYGGLGGLIIEGEPGVGKSELVVKCLEMYGLKKADLHDTNLQAEVYFHIPVGMSPEDKIKLLRLAFDMGAVVMIDEINCAPMIEDLINHLLMGQTPEGKRPTHPGFLLFGTQNPITMSGRLDTSPAIKSRTFKTIIEPYTQPQMLEILLQKGVSMQESLDIVNEYLFLRTHQPQIPLCFRDVLRVAENIIKKNVVTRYSASANSPSFFQAVSLTNPHHSTHHGDNSKFRARKLSDVAIQEENRCPKRISQGAHF